MDQWASLQALSLRAQDLLAKEVRRTPLVESFALSARFGFPVFLKLENLQLTNSFKYRPALFSLLSDLERARSSGVVTSSSGNFAGAVAAAASKFGVEARVVMRPSAAGFKVEKTRKWGASIVRCEDRYEAREETVQELVAKEGLLHLHPHGSPETVAGDTTVAEEIARQLPEVAHVLVPASGAGLLGGIAFQLRDKNVDVWGVQPEANGTLVKSLAEGTPCYREGIETVADGLTAAIPGRLGFQLVQQFAQGAHVVSEEALLTATRLLFEEEGFFVEPAGAAGVAAFLEGFRPRSIGPCVVVVTGGNVDPHQWAKWFPSSKT